MKQDEYRALVNKTCETVTEVDPDIVQGLSATIKKALPKELSGAKVRGVIDSSLGVVFKLRCADTSTRYDHFVTITPAADPEKEQQQEEDQDLEDKEIKSPPETTTKKPQSNDKTRAKDLETK